MERMEDLNATGRMHKVTMTNRRTCTVNGVNDVLSFDLREILLETEQGMLMIRGNELHVNRLTLNKGEVDIDGQHGISGRSGILDLLCGKGLSADVS